MVVSMKAGDSATKGSQKGSPAADSVESTKALASLIAHSTDEVLVAVNSPALKLLLSPSTKRAVTDAVKRGVSFRVLLPAGHESANAEDFRQLGASVSMSKRRLPVHFAVVDGRHVWYESPSRGDAAAAARTVLKHAPQSATRLRRLFTVALTESLDERS